MKIYSVYQDDDGHNYLIPVEELKSFKEELEAHEALINRARRGEIVNPEEDEDYQVDWAKEELNYLFDKYERLEGEEYYVILKSDL